ncbi:MAG: ComF family protein, partial [Rhodobacterales bacterium]|nr:ComF family protein [Rhodobacterales bacterium]
MTPATHAPPLGDLARRVLDAVMPPQCLSCGTLIDGAAGPTALCPDCWGHMTFLGEPHCVSCGLPFELDVGPGARCAACLRHPPPFDRARAAFAYDDASKGLILSFKHGDRTDAAPAFGAWLARAGADLLDGADLLVPVPLHWTRLFLRRYNQAALLAAALAQATGLRHEPDLLVRVRRTPSQGTKGVGARRRNLAGAFALRRRGADVLRGARVV